MGRSKAQAHLLRELSGADYVTLAAVFLITCAFWAAAEGRIFLAVGLAFTSMFLDYADGTVARRYGGSDYGQVYDSLYDILGWVMFPAYIINLRLGWPWWSLIVTSLYCVFAVVRLGRFTVKGYVKEEKSYYTGLPVLFSKYALLAAFLPRFGWISVFMLALMIPLMVSSRLVKKPHPVWAQLELVYAAIFFGLAVHG